MKKSNVGIQPDNIPYIHTTGGKKIVYLLKTGLKNYRFINPIISKDIVAFNVGEEDVNWAINDYERAKKAFGQSLLMQLLPFIVLAFTSIIILILFIFLFKKLDVLSEFGASLAEAAKYVAQAKSGTTIIGG